MVRDVIKESRDGNPYTILAVTHNQIILNAFFTMVFRKELLSRGKYQRHERDSFCTDGCVDRVRTTVTATYPIPSYSTSSTRRGIHCTTATVQLSAVRFGINIPLFHLFTQSEVALTH